MKKTILTIAVAAILAGCAQSSVPAYMQADKPVDKRVEDLMSRMTLEEKILQISQYTFGPNDNINNISDRFVDLPDNVGSFIFSSDDLKALNELQRRAVEDTRLGIPILFGCDIIHGFRTVFPIPLAQGCSWNPSLVEELGSVAASEARRSGIAWTFSPMIDVARDGRWGRVAEGYGEDPYTNAVMGAAAVRGYQGESIADPDRIASCLKHYAGYGRSEGGRDYTATDISRQSLWDTYLPPYEACVNADAKTVMSSFNDISGTPATANRYLLTDVLKKKWGFDGFVVSDWNAVDQLVLQGAAKDRREAAKIALEAGLDMDMRDDCYREFLPELASSGEVSEKRIDDAVRRVLKLKFELGLFENPYVPETGIHERLLKPEYINAAERMALESMVLLKNKDNALPLGKSEKYAVIGPVAKDRRCLLGSWICHGNENDVESLYEGLEKVFGPEKLLYAKGCDFDGDDKSGFAHAKNIASRADAIILCLGEKAAWSGENASRSTLKLPQIQEDLAATLHATGKPVILILSNGRPLELMALEKNADAILEIWQPGIAGGTPMARILAGDENPSGKLCMTFPLTSGQIPVYYNERQSSRPHMGHYQDITIEPLYKFGHGLSYTKFTYGDISLSTVTPGKEGKMIATVKVRNTGGKDGYETVHWFIRDPYSTITRPVKELKHFEKKFIKAGESETFSFEIEPWRDLSYTDHEGNRILEDGEYNIIVNGQSIEFEF